MNKDHINDRVETKGKVLAKAEDISSTKDSSVAV
jgi:hypothetical protein